MNRYKILIVDKPFEGTGIEIISKLKSYRFLRDDIELSEYLDELCQNIFRLYGKGIYIDRSKSLEEQCEQFVEEAIKYNFIKTV